MLQKFQIQIEKKAQKELNNIPEYFRQTIITVFNRLLENPYKGKKLGGKYLGYYSIRAWPYRIIYEILEKEVIVIVIKIGHRKDVYRK